MITPAVPFPGEFRPAPKRKNPAGIAFVVVVIVVWIISALNKSTPKPTPVVTPYASQADNSPYAASTPFSTPYAAFTPYPIPYTRPSPVWTAPPGTYLVSTPTPHYASFNGVTYNVPDSDYRYLQQRQGMIETAARNLAAARATAKELGDEIEMERTTIDRSDDAAIDNFNAKVNRYNAMEAGIDSDVTQYNSMVDSYNAELQRVGTPAR